VVYPADEETFDARATPEFIRQGHLNSIQQFLKRIQDFLGYGGRLHDEKGLVNPVGIISPYAGLSAPSGWLLCDGELYNGAASDYADLYAVIGQKYGAGAGDYFHVPDLRGVFLRGLSKTPDRTFDNTKVWPVPDEIVIFNHEYHRTGFPIRLTTSDTLPAPFLINTTYYVIRVDVGTIQLAASRANAFAGTQIDITTSGAGTQTVHSYLEEDEDSRLKLADGGNDGEDLGSYQPDEFDSHAHSISPTAIRYDYLNGATSGTAILAGANQIFGTAATGGSETRPRNVNVNYIIKR